MTVTAGDNLEVLRGMNSEAVDLIYLDPPFNSNKTYSAPIGSKAAGAAFKDAWELTDSDTAWHDGIADGRPAMYAVIEAAGLAHGKGMKAYLTMMAARLLELHRVLKPTGSVWLHCNQDAGHYLKLLMDCVFDKAQFITGVIWNYGTPSGGRSAGKKPVKAHDYLLVYAKDYGRQTYNRQFTPYGESYKAWFRHDDGDGRLYRTRSRQGKIVKQYLDESPGIPLSTCWNDIKQIYGQQGWFPGTQKEGLGYPTQKPLALLERIIKASSNEGDIVLDPFCGCGTALVAAEKLGRRWVGVDISPSAVALTKRRLQDEARLN